MAQCRYCHRKVSYRAKACPGCGEPNPGRRILHGPSRDYVADDLFWAMVRVAILAALLIAWNYSNDVDQWEDLFLLLFKLWISAIGAALVGGILWLAMVRHRKIHHDNNENDSLFNGLKLGLNACFFVLVIWTIWAVLT